MDRTELEALLASYAEQAGPRKPPNGDVVSLEEILAAHERLGLEDDYPPLYRLCERYRAVDVYAALQREADRGTIQPTWIDEDSGYILRYQPTEERE